MMETSTLVKCSCDKAPHPAVTSVYGKGAHTWDLYSKDYGHTDTLGLMAEVKLPPMTSLYGKSA
jgi:hypothetical protein